MNRPVGPYLWMLWSAASFSTMGALSKVLAQSSDWRFLAFVRAALMLLFAVAIGLATRTTFMFRGTPMLWMRSLVGSLSMICTFYTLTHLPFSEATTLIKSYPIWVALLSWVVLKDRPSLKVWCLAFIQPGRLRISIRSSRYATSKFLRVPYCPWWFMIFL